ncbi:MAG: helix-turn-helix transcriptional regulator [Clostridia bacterium]|nr:helix-turn-helix transcriptional regulator [Clostridia bacterium]
MTKLTLGEKIRRRRRELHLTQEALAGESVTRILISRIESGDVNPSLETLKYLAERLGVPAGYLLTEEDDLLQFLLPRIKEELRDKYRRGDDAGVFALCEQYGLQDEETSMILCECAVRLGGRAYERGATAEASEWFDRALSYAEKTPYHTEFVLGEAVLCKAMLAEMADEAPSVFLDSYAEALGRAVDWDRYLLLRFFADLKQRDANGTKPWHEAVPIGNPLYREIRRIWICEADGDTLGAKNALAELLHGDHARELERDPMLQYRCIAKMEQLSALTDDYKTAYLYAGKRSQLERRYRLRHEENQTAAADDDVGLTV